MLTKAIDILITEPWDAYGTFTAYLINQIDGQLLFKLTTPLLHKNREYYYLIGIFVDTNQIFHFNNNNNGLYQFNFFYSEEINESNFALKILKFRNDFLSGEIKL